MSKTGKTLVIILCIFCVCAISFCSIWTATNWAKISGGSNNGLYTQEDLDKAREEGYRDAASSNGDTKIQALEQFLREKDAELVKLNATKTDLQNQVNAQKTQITTLQTQLNTTTNERNALESKKAELQQEIENNNQQIASNNQKISDLQSEIDQLTNNDQSNQSQITSLTSQLKSLQTENTRISSINNNNTITIESLYGQITALNSEYDRLYLQLQEYKSQSETLARYESQIATLTAEINEINLKIANLRTLLVDSNQKCIAVFRDDGKFYDVKFAVPYDNTAGATNSDTAGIVEVPNSPGSSTRKIFNGWKVENTSTIVNFATYKLTEHTIFDADYTYYYNVTFTIESAMRNESRMVIVKQGNSINSQYTEVVAKYNSANTKLNTATTNFNTANTNFTEASNNQIAKQNAYNSALTTRNDAERVFNEKTQAKNIAEHEYRDVLNDATATQAQKDKAKAKFDASISELSDATATFETAKTNLQTAQQELTSANNLKMQAEENLRIKQNEKTTAESEKTKAQTEKENLEYIKATYIESVLSSADQTFMYFRNGTEVIESNVFEKTIDFDANFKAVFKNKYGVTINVGNKTLTLKVPHGDKLDKDTYKNAYENFISSNSLNLQDLEYWTLTNGSVTNSQIKNLLQNVIYSNSTFTAYFRKTGLLSTYDGNYIKQGSTDMTWQYLKANNYITISNGNLMGGTNKLNLNGYLVISEEVTNIGESAFENCTGLTGIYVPKTVSTISKNAFKGCSNIAIISIESGEIIGTNPDETYIYNGVKTLGESCFSGLKKLSNVYLGDQVTTIGKNAFSNSFTDVEKKAIYLPNSIETINATSVSESIFYGCPSDLIIFTNNYGSMPMGWGQYWNYYSDNRTVFCEEGASYYTYLNYITATSESNV